MKGWKWQCIQILNERPRLINFSFIFYPVGNPCDIIEWLAILQAINNIQKSVFAFLPDDYVNALYVLDYLLMAHGRKWPAQYDHYVFRKLFNDPAQRKSLKSIIDIAGNADYGRLKIFNYFYKVVLIVLFQIIIQNPY